MGKTRRKNHSEVEHLRGENKKLKSQIRRLERHNKELQRKSHFFEDVMSETTKEIKSIDYCKECGKGELELIDFGFVEYVKCQICDFREKVNGKEAKSKKEIK